MTTYILNIILFIISQLTFSNGFSYERNSDSDNFIISSEKITLNSLEADEYLDINDETSKHYLAVDLNNAISKKSQSTLKGRYSNHTLGYLNLLNLYIDLPPPSNS